jgi:hypothetical protein
MRKRDLEQDDQLGVAANTPFQIPTGDRWSCPRFFQVTGLPDLSHIRRRAR